MPVFEATAAVLLDGVAVLLLGWTTWTVLQAREHASAWTFAVAVGTMACWALFSLLAESSSALGVSVVGDLATFGQLGCALLLPGIWTVYALGYTGRGTGLTRWRVVMFAGIAAPVVLSGAVIAAGLPTTTIERLVASLAGTAILTLLILIVYATYLLVDLGWNHARVSKHQVLVLSLAVTAPYLAGMLGDGHPAANGVTVGFLTAGGLFAIAVRRYPVLTVFPKAEHIARTRVVETLQEAVLVLDWDDHVLDANGTVGQVFDQPPASLIGQPVQAVADEFAQLDLTVGTTGTSTLQTTKGRRRFQYSVSAVEDDATQVAKTVLLRDVTDQQTREQRLAVLNRILRHNLRNKLDIVLAHAEQIDDDTLRSGVQENAEDLVVLSEKARKAEDVMQDSLGPPERTNITALVTTVAAEFRAEYPASEIDVTCPEECLIESHPALLREVLAELIENALTHTDRSTPRIEITVNTDAPAVELTVTDNGPGIPECERQILTEGAESQLKHSQGIGLWFVNWAVTQLGGTLSFGDRDSQGSTVTVRLHEVLLEVDR
jgi:signal transduction histidine kinase